ncbi:MAG: hypothetical protein L0Z53_16410, partial [Acidobacteriales bacterium]|nr:hypothetical protein [Terriglobales bacterium]
MSYVIPNNSFVRAVINILFLLAMCWFATYVARAAELNVPQQVAAGKGFSIPTTGSGEQTFYLLGPATAAKRIVKLGESIEIAPEEVRVAGRYLAILGKGDDA